MFENMVGFGLQSFCAILITLSAAVSAHLMHGYGTRRAKETFVGLMLATMFLYQLFYLVKAAQFMPLFPEPWDESLVRKDCVGSGKSGKRPGMRQEAYDINPCFCHTGATCMTMDGAAVSYNGTCPTNGDYKCHNNATDLYIPLYISNERNCRGGMGPFCTQNQPCDPCEYSKISTFVADNDYEGRCSACSTDNRGECHFVPGTGPYCRVAPGSKKIEPCKQCCTESAVYYDSSGVCY
jgi:hypothetical protein